MSTYKKAVFGSEFSKSTQPNVEARVRAIEIRLKLLSDDPGWGGAGKGRFILFKLGVSEYLTARCVHRCAPAGLSDVSVVHVQQHGVLASEAFGHQMDGIAVVRAAVVTDSKDSRAAMFSPRPSLGSTLCAVPSSCLRLHWH